MGAGRRARALSECAVAGLLPKAQPYAPYPVQGKRAMRVFRLKENASGLPTATLADEILLDGQGQIKVLFCLGATR
jgi:hypothetical protein